METDGSAVCGFDGDGNVGDGGMETRLNCQITIFIAKFQSEFQFTQNFALFD